MMAGSYSAPKPSAGWRDRKVTDVVGDKLRRRSENSPSSKLQAQSKFGEMTNKYHKMDERKWEGDEKATRSRIHDEKRGVELERVYLVKGVKSYA